jgi:multidrug efflux pump subunit AcrA (membrane-fusion protein)
MKRSVKLVAAVALVAVTVATVLWWTGRAQRQTEAQEAGRTASPATNPPVAIDLAANEVMTVSPTRIARTIPVTGTLNAVEQTVVKSRVSGDIQQIRVREGTSVKAGDLIATIETLLK